MFCTIMHNFLFIVLQALVIVKCLSISVDQFDDLSEELSSPESNEIFRGNDTYFAGGMLNNMNETCGIVFPSKHIGNETNPSNVTHRNYKSEEDKGSTTLINYPFAVSIQRKAAHYATGALIDKRWILTCAGEFYNIRASIKLFRARLGSVDCKRGGILVPVKRVEIHPSYIYGLPNFDLALLRMAQLVEFTDFIKPIGLSKIRTKVISAKFMTTYWPRVIIKGELLPLTAKERIKQNSMRVSTQRLIPHSKCLVKVYDKLQNSTLHASSLCLKPFVSHHSPCMPDAGAPVVAEDGLWGITSGWTSEDCLLEPSPTVFSRVSSLVVRAWLDSLLLTSV